VTLPLYDGRECPLCRATVCGKASRKAHKEWHEQREEYDHQVTAAIQSIAQRAGLTVQMRTWEEAGSGAGDPYETVRVRPETDDSDDEWDEDDGT
jgi:hypothetical protein